MTKRHYTIPSLLILASFSAQAALVFQDDFSDPDSTLLHGKAADIGSAWNVTDGASDFDIQAGSLDTLGAGRTAYASFTSILAAGQTVTLTFDTLDQTNGGNMFNGYSGVSLYEGGNEQIFVGNPSAGFWGVTGGGISGANSSDSTVVATATFTYIFDSGDWTFATTSGVSLAGTGTAGLAFDELRIANGSGSDIHLDNISVDVSAVPEPSSSALIGLGGLSLILRRRK